MCLDATDAVLDEAIELKVKFIITHHPFIFGGLSRITDSDNLGKKVIKAIKNGINIYSAHTNLDFCSGGINEFLALTIGLKNLKPIDNYISENEGFGRIGELEKATQIDDFVATISEKLNDKNIRVVRGSSATIKKVAVINGSGGGDTTSIDKALANGCDCLVTSELKHHIALYAKELGITIIEPTHYTSERVYLQAFVNTLKSKLVDIEVLLSSKETNPYN